MKQRWFLVFLLLPVSVVIFIQLWTGGLFRDQYDDSYITYRYAINLAHGHGLVFNVGEHTDSASSFLYTLVLCGFYLLKATDLEAVGAAIGLVSLCVTCFLIYKLALFLSGNRAAAMIVAVAGGLNGFFSGWTTTGMETLPWSALILLAIYLMAVDADYRLTLLAIAAAAFTRFEGILLVIPYLILTYRRPGRRKTLIPLAAMVAAFLLFYIVKHQYYGVWISHAYHMKEIALYYRPAPRYLFHLWIRYASVPLLLSMPTLLRRSCLFALAYILLSLSAVLLGPGSDFGRYSVHLLPILYGFSAPVVAKMLGGAAPFRYRLIPVFTILAMFAQAFEGMRFNIHNLPARGADQVCREKLAYFVKSHIDPNETIASSDLGLISYIDIDYRFVDLIALTSADVLAEYKQGHTADEVLARKNVRYIADTYTLSSANRLDDLLEEFPIVKGKSRFTVDAAHPMMTCLTNPAYGLQVATILLKQNRTPAPRSAVP